LSRTSERIIVRYLRPPRDIQIAKPNVAKAKKALTDITAQVNSIPKLVGVEAEINGRRITSESKAEDAGGGVWKVLLKNVPLDEGKNRVTMWASNAEARSLTPGIIEFDFHRPQAAKPEVTFRDPSSDQNVPTSIYKVQFRVRSESSLSRVQLLRGEEVVHTAPAEKLNKPAGRDVFEFSESATVALEPGLNRLEAVAVNDGGEQRAAVVLSY